MIGQFVGSINQLCKSVYVLAFCISLVWLQAWPFLNHKPPPT